MRYLRFHLGCGFGNAAIYGAAIEPALCASSFVSNYDFYVQFEFVTLHIRKRRPEFG